MPKRGINPVTLRPLDTHPGNAVTFARMHVSEVIKTGRAVAKSTSLPDLLRHGLLKMFSVVVFDEAAVTAAREAGEDHESLMHATTIDEDKFIDALGHLFPNGEMALVHLNGDAKLLKDMLDTFRQIAVMKKDGEGADPDDDGYVMENDDNYETLTDLINTARGYMERLGEG